MPPNRSKFPIMGHTRNHETKNSQAPPDNRVPSGITGFVMRTRIVLNTRLGNRSGRPRRGPTAPAFWK